MNKPAALIATAASVAALVILNLKKNHDYNEYFAETFPNLDPQVLKKAHGILMRKAFTNKIDMAGWSKARYEDMLVAEYKLLSQ
jgi:hypothetical protein